MSTKTIYKRIALVAVAALGFGLLSVAPSTAISQADTLTFASAATTTTIGSTAVAVINQSFVAGAIGDSLSVTASLVSAPAGSAFPLVPTASGTNVNAGVNVITTTYTSSTLATGIGYTTGFTTATFTPTVVGTYVVKFTPAIVAGGGILQAAPITWTFTVAAAGTSSAATSTSFIQKGILALPIVPADSVVNISSAVNAAAAAHIYVTPLTAAGGAITVPEKLTVTVTGPGTAGIGTAVNAVSVGKSFTAANAGEYIVSVWADGIAGVSTITIKSGTVTLGVETVTFVGSTASVTATVVSSVIAIGANVGAITAIAKDAGGNVVQGVTLYATSDTVATISNSYTPAVAVTDSAGKASFTLTGVVAGTAMVTIGTGSSSTATTNIAAAAVSIRVGSSTASAVTMSFDKATYAPGELATITVTVKDSTGLAVVNGPYTVFAADVTSTRVMTGTPNLPLMSVTVASGIKTYSVNMPISTGVVTISALGAAGLAAAQAGIAISATATVEGSSEVLDAINAAADAAAEATDAANAATDAANAAAEAADAATAASQDAADAANAAVEAANAATDAVAALSVQVGTLIAGLKAQLRSLTNLIIRMQKKLNKLAKRR